MCLEGPLCYLELDSGPSDMPFWPSVLFVLFVVRAPYTINTIFILSSPYEKTRVEGEKFSISCSADHERD